MKHEFVFVNKKHHRIALKIRWKCVTGTNYNLEQITFRFFVIAHCDLILWSCGANSSTSQYYWIQNERIELRFASNNIAGKRGRYAQKLKYLMRLTK